MKPQSQSAKAKRRPLLGPPPKQPPEIEELLASNDFIELRYRSMAGLRERKKLTTEQESVLAKHDALENRIQESPSDVMKEAYDALDHGTSLLLKLIRSKRLRERIFYRDGSVYSESDKAYDCLASRIDFLNRQLVRLAEAGVPRSRQFLFYQAKSLTEAFIRLAQAHPGDFINAAESALTMPSLRTQNLNYTADAEAIGKAIHLGVKHPAGRMTDDKERIGELSGYLVVKLLEHIVWAREHYQQEMETLEMLKNFHETKETHRETSIEERLRNNLYPTIYEHVMACAALPELREDPVAWWKLRVKPLLREEFERMKRKPDTNAALWSELGRSTNQGTDGARWKALSDNCRNKLNQLARRQ